MGTFNGARITGLKNVEIRLNAELTGIRVRSGKGLVQFAIRVRREMETVQPFTPLDTGKLRASWQANLFWRSGVYSMIMGFSSNYAIYVHAFQDSTTNWSRTGSGGQWFEKALKRNLPLLVKDIQTGK